ncbi:MAG: hypothetical protein JJ902_04020 [Roseibium sp.]|nr:hypothetical protein [Roseibium sp.]
MPRYAKRKIIRSAADNYDPILDDAPLLPNLEVSEHTATPTGILDADGSELMRLPEPIGFVWKD